MCSKGNPVKLRVLGQEVTYKYIMQAAFFLYLWLLFMLGWPYVYFSVRSRRYWCTTKTLCVCPFIWAMKRLSPSVSSSAGCFLFSWNEGMGGKMNGNYSGSRHNRMEPLARMLRSFLLKLQVLVWQLEDKLFSIWVLKIKTATWKSLQAENQSWLIDLEYVNPSAFFHFLLFLL